MLKLELTKRTDSRLLQLMAEHYSQPKGFVGRNRCFSVSYNDTFYGYVVAGSATKFLPNRNEFFGNPPLNNIVNNIFCSFQKSGGKYPTRNFTSLILKEWRKVVIDDWYKFYGDCVLGFETLVELPRTGVLYVRDGWDIVGVTKGYTCKRIGGKGSDSWTGKRVWDTTNLRPKLVLCRRV